MKLALLALASITIFAQPDRVTDRVTGPSYWLAAGGGYSHSPGPKVGGLISIGIKITPTTFSYTTSETAALGASTRTGLATIIYQSPKMVLLGLADLGVSTGTSGSLGGAYSGGFVTAFKLDRWFKNKNIYAGVDVRIERLNAIAKPSRQTISLIIARAF